MSLFKKKPVVDWSCACGRTFLSVNGYVVAMEGDVIRDSELTVKNHRLMQELWGKVLHPEGMRIFSDDEIARMANVWSGELIKSVCAEANGGKLPQ